MRISSQSIKLGIAAIGAAVIMLSAHFSMQEATTTQTGIENTIDSNSLKNIKLVVDSVFEPSREKLGAIYVSSAFRNQEVNQAVGGVRNSQHTRGEALDLIYRKNGINKNRELFKFIKDSIKNFDQLIWEYDGAWVHVSYKKTKNRHQIIY